MSLFYNPSNRYGSNFQNMVERYRPPAIGIGGMPAGPGPRTRRFDKNAYDEARRQSKVRDAETTVKIMEARARQRRLEQEAMWDRWAAVNGRPHPRDDGQRGTATSAPAATSAPSATSAPAAPVRGKWVTIAPDAPATSSAIKGTAGSPGSSITADPVTGEPRPIAPAASSATRAPVSAKPAAAPSSTFDEVAYRERVNSQYNAIKQRQAEMADEEERKKSRTPNAQAMAWKEDNTPNLDLVRDNRDWRTNPYVFHVDRTDSNAVDQRGDRLSDYIRRNMPDTFELDWQDYNQGLMSPTQFKIATEDAVSRALQAMNLNDLKSLEKAYAQINKEDRTLFNNILWNALLELTSRRRDESDKKIERGVIPSQSYGSAATASQQFGPPVPPEVRMANVDWSKDPLFRGLPFREPTPTPIQ